MRTFKIRGACTAKLPNKLHLFALLVFLLCISFPSHLWARTFSITNNVQYGGKYELRFTVIDEELRTCKLSGATNSSLPHSLNIPSIVNDGNLDYTVTAIGEGALKLATQLTSISIPETTRNIEKSAFEQCRYLKEIKGTSLTFSIGDYAFKGCYDLVAINLSNATEIGVSAFESCYSLANINLLKAITIGESAFKSCEKIKTLILPSSVSTIGSAAFQGCYDLSTIDIPDNVTTLEDNVFSSCRNLSSITIPNSIKSIGNHAFDGCSTLASIELPSSITSIGEFAFSSCSNLTSVSIPINVTNIATCCFEGCI